MKSTRLVRTVFFTLFFVIVSSIGHSAIRIEPSLGFAIGEIDSTPAQLGTNAIDHSFSSAGLRVGYHMLGFSLGLDYLKTLSGSFDDDSNNRKGDFSADAFSVFAGFDFPILLRAYAGYTFSYTSETDFDDTTATIEHDGNGYFVGVSFTGLPFVYLNLEYRVYEIDEFEQSGVTTSISDTNDKTFMLSVSLPIDL